VWIWFREPETTWLGEPETSYGNDLEHGIWMKYACFIIFVGPCLPFLGFIFPRSSYSFCMIIFDALKLCIVVYALLEDGFTSPLWLSTVKVLSTACCMILKGLDLLDCLLKCDRTEHVIQKWKPGWLQPRARRQLDFTGRAAPAQQFSIVSFPGIELEVFEEIMEIGDDLDIACVFSLMTMNSMAVMQPHASARYCTKANILGKVDVPRMGANGLRSGKTMLAECCRTGRRPLSYTDVVKQTPQMVWDPRSRPRLRGSIISLRSETQSSKLNMWT